MYVKNMSNLFRVYLNSLRYRSKCKYVLYERLHLFIFILFFICDHPKCCRIPRQIAHNRVRPVLARACSEVRVLHAAPQKKIMILVCLLVLGLAIVAYVSSYFMWGGAAAAVGARLASGNATRASLTALVFVVQKKIMIMLCLLVLGLVVTGYVYTKFFT